MTLDDFGTKGTRSLEFIFSMKPWKLCKDMCVTPCHTQLMDVVNCEAWDVLEHHLI